MYLQELKQGDSASDSDYISSGSDTDLCIRATCCVLGSPGLGSCKYTSEVFSYSCAQGLQNDLFSLGYLNAVLKAFSSVPFMHAAHPIHFIFKVCLFKFYEEYKLMNLQIHFFILLFIFFF